MKKSMRDNDRIESVLRNLPKIYDQRSNQVIFLKINETKEFQAKKQKQFRYVVISSVVIIIFTVIAAAIFLDDRFSLLPQLFRSLFDL